MKIARPAFYAVSLSVLVGALAGCGSQPQPMSFSPGVFGQLAAERTAPLHVDHRKSWVSPEVARLPRILFVSDDSTNDVLLFS
ncbi:MAG: hypothetical protein WBP75_13180, partial [Candidatus Cybelea sp.]